METPKKGIIGKALSSIFGTTSPLTNEPTIDYNNTIQTYPTYNEDTISTQRLRRPYRNHSMSGFDDDSRRNGPYVSDQINKDKNYKDLFSDQYVIDSQALDDSDDDLNSDIDYIFNRYNHTNELVNNLPKRMPSSISNRDSQLDFDKKLPMGYPGRFPSPLVLLRESHRYTSDSIDNDLKKLEREINLENDITTARLNARYNQYPTYDTKKVGKYEALNDAANSNETRLNEMVNRISDRNKFLNELNTFVDLNDQVEVPADINEKYKALREEYIKELTNCQNFYKAYYKLVFKYRNLKKEVGNSSMTPIREKIKLIKSTSQQLSIRIVCDNLLTEIDKSDKLIAHYKNELALANSKIKHLEDKLAKQGLGINS